MRFALVALCAFTLAACGQATPPEDASAGSTGVGEVAAPSFTVEPEALIGLWGFDRTCGLYDLVFEADDRVQYFDYSDQSGVVSYAGTWATAENNRVVLTVYLLDSEGEPTAAVSTFHLDVQSTVTDDLIGDFGPAGGASQTIRALRCPEEDRE
jgi:hypothetical protein